jgi:GNAT superfamily N-acetyltransferase
MHTDRLNGLTVDLSPPESDGDLLDKRLDEFNVTATRRDDYAPLLMVCRDDRGEILAGIKGATGWDWLHVQVLWVAQTLRKNGIASRLLAMAEEEGRRRGCKYSRLSTFSFQARPFYERHGYEVFAELPNYPGTETKYLMKKQL